MPFDRTKLRELRQMNALSLRELSARSGVAYDTIHGIEVAHQSPRPSTLRRLADALGVPPQALFSTDAPEGMRKVSVLGGHYDPDELLTVAEIADETAWGESTVRKFVKDEGLSAVRRRKEGSPRVVNHYRWGDFVKAATALRPIRTSHLGMTPAWRNTESTSGKAAA